MSADGMLAVRLFGNHDIGIDLRSELAESLVFSRLHFNAQIATPTLASEPSPSE